MKRLFKWLAYGVATLIVFAALLAGITQTQFFRDQLRSFALAKLDSLLDADVHLGEIQGNLVTGFSIDTVSIRVNGEEFVSADRLDIRYDLFQIFSRRISVGSLTLVRPKIALLCGRDSIWNFARMVRPTPEDSTTNPFNWPIAVRQFEIRDGSFRLVDSARLAESDHILSNPYFVEYHNFSVDSLNMTVSSALVTPGEKRATIKTLRFVSETPSLRLAAFSGEFSVTRHDAAIKKLELRTGRSHLLLNASMSDVDLLGGITLSNLKNNAVDLSLRTTDIDLAELKRFIPQIDFLNGMVTSEIVADGTFGKLQVRQLDLRTFGSDLHFAGLVSNLDNPEKLLLNVKCRQSTVRYADVVALMPSLGLPDSVPASYANLEFDFDGEPLDFATTMAAQTDAGSFSTTGATLLIGGRGTLRYKGDFLVRHVKPDRLLQDPSLKGDLNGLLAINGYGTSLDSLNGTYRLQADSSEFLGIPVGPTQISLTAANRRLDGIVSLTMGSMRTQFRAALDRSNLELPAFNVEGDISSLNLAEFLHDESQSSSLTLGLRAEGTGLQWDKLSGEATIDLSSSRYKEYKIDSSHVNLSIDQRDPLHSNITLKSDVADFSIAGQFDLDYMGRLIGYEIDNLRLAIGRRFRSLDSTLATSFDEEALAVAGKRLAADRKTLNAEYELTVKDLEPLSILTGNRMFDAVGTIAGSLKGNYENLEGVANLRLREFFYGNADSGMLVQEGVGSLRFNDLRPDNVLSELTLRVRLDAGKMHINRTRLDTLNIGVFYDKEYAGFVFQADYDKDYHFKTNGQVGVSDDGVQFTLSNLLAAYQDFSWHADDGAIIAVTKNGMRIQNMTFRRDTQIVSLNGNLLSGSKLDVVLSAQRLNLEQLRYLFSREETRGNTHVFEGVARLDAHASGTLSDPDYDATLTAQNVFYRGFPFGEIQGTLNYKNESLAAKLLIDHRADRSVGVPDLTVTGTLPVNLALQGAGERLTDRPMDFTVYSDGFQMSLLDPLLPTFNDLSGILKANFKVGGTPKKPSFTGSMSIEGSSFLFVPNNMYYTLEGTYRPEGERIKVLTTTVRNVASDNRPGREGVIHITGDFALSELVPSDFNLNIKGQLLVVNKNTRTSSLEVYGELPVEIAPSGLHFSGNLDHTLLKGQVLVRNSSLSFPPTTSSAKEDTFFIPFRFVNDTTKAQDTTDSGVSRYFSSVLRGRETSQTNGEVRSRSFIDGLRYDLGVEFAGSNNEVRMIFNPATNEELVASITGQVAITEDGKAWNGTLDVRRASYNFYGKRFDAEGTIIYSGNFLNPELDITATYKGTRKYNDASTEENVVVTYKITGTRFAPRPEISMTIDGVDYYAYKATPTSNDVQSDALTFIITNNFPLTRGERNNIAEQVGPTVGAGLVGGATSLLTSTLAEFLRNKTGFINSFEFRYDQSGTFGQSADVRLGGTAFKGYWRYGGKILEDPFYNANFSILYSFGDIFDNPTLRNFMVELERRVDTLTLFGSVEARKEITAARFFYRFSF